MKRRALLDYVSLLQLLQSSCSSCSCHCYDFVTPAALSGSWKFSYSVIFLCTAYSEPDMQETGICHAKPTIIQRRKIMHFHTVFAIYHRPSPMVCVM